MLFTFSPRLLLHTVAKSHKNVLTSAWVTWKNSQYVQLKYLGGFTASGRCVPNVLSKNHNIFWSSLLANLLSRIFGHIPLNSKRSCNWTRLIGPHNNPPTTFSEQYRTLDWTKCLTLLQSALYYFPGLLSFFLPSRFLSFVVANTFCKIDVAIKKIQVH